MEFEDFPNIPKTNKFDGFSKEKAIRRCQVLEFELSEVIKENYKLRESKITDEQIQLLMAEQLDSLNETIFGQKSERYKKSEKKSNGRGDSNSAPKKKVKKPSERYPNLPVREEIIAMDQAPHCRCCNELMTDSGMSEDSEQLTVIPKKYEILLQKRIKYRCSCHGSLITTPAPPRIIEGSTYSDEMIMDVALSKYCDLIPIDRYGKMAARSGLIDLPPNSLIATTHKFADFVRGAYDLVKAGILTPRVICADETPHRMLEGSDKKRWYLWGFSTPNLCFLECHNTRSGDVASDILTQSNCEVLMSDVFSGYGKAIREANKLRAAAGLPLIRGAHCNAHARRYFFKAWKKGKKHKEAEFYLDHYHEIYQLNSKAKEKPPDEVLQLRSQMKPRFEAMKKRALEELPCYPKDGKYAKALKYLLNNYNEFIFFLTDPEIPIDNNRQEGTFRSHVVGRKTWYGTHSQRGAETAAILFTLVETCKLNQVNPREYFEHLVADLLAGSKPYTPADFKKSN
jgi:transposase